MKIVWKLLKPYLIENRNKLFLGIICLILVNLLQLTIPLFIAYAIDISLNSSHIKKLIFCLSAILIISLVMGILRFGWRNWLIGVSRIIERDLRDDFFQQIQDIELYQIKKYRTGDIVSLSYNDIGAIRRMLGSGIMSVCDAVVIIIVAFSLMFYLSTSLSWKIILPFPLISIFMAYMGNVLNKSHAKLQDSFSDLTSNVQEYISGIRVIRSFVKEKYSIIKIIKISSIYLKHQMRLAICEGIFYPVIRFLSKVSLTILIFFGGKMVIEGEMSLGVFVAFSEYINLLFWPLLAAGFIINAYEKGKAGCVRINRIMKLKPEILSNKAYSFFKISDSPEILEIKQLNFSYPETDSQVLKNISFRIYPKEKIGIIGGIGSGKTTLINVLLRLYSIPENIILYGNQCMNQIPIEVWRQMIGYVHQEPFIFSSTIKENIILSNDENKSDDFWDSIKDADLYQDTISFHEKENTHIGEWGITLSGGQRQRLAIARIIHQKYPIYIFDDCFSSVDIETETKIFSNIQKHIKNATTIMSTHRLNLLDKFDRLIFLSHGEISGIGSHDELYQSNLEYRKNYDHQQIENQLLLNRSRQNV